MNRNLKLVVNNVSKDFIYVTDVVDVIITSILRNKNGIFNIGSGNTYSINYLVNLLGGKKTFIKKMYFFKRTRILDITINYL